MIKISSKSWREEDPLHIKDPMNETMYSLIMPALFQDEDDDGVRDTIRALRDTQHSKKEILEQVDAFGDLQPEKVEPLKQLVQEVFDEPLKKIEEGQKDTQTQLGLNLEGMWDPNNPYKT
jgi:hypothetical protein